MIGAVACALRVCTVEQRCVQGSAPRRPVSGFLVSSEHPDVKNSVHNHTVLHTAFFFRATYRDNCCSLISGHSSFPYHRLPHAGDAVYPALVTLFFSLPPFLCTGLSSARNFRIFRPSGEAGVGPVSEGDGRFSIEGGREGLGRAGRAVPRVPRPPFSSVCQGAWTKVFLVLMYVGRFAHLTDRPLGSGRLAWARLLQH